VDLDPEVLRDLRQAHTDVAFGSEPEGSAEGQASRKGLADEQAGGSVASADGCRFVEEGPRIEDLEHLRVGPAYRLLVGLRQEPRQLTITGLMDPLQQPVVAVCRKRQRFVVIELGRAYSEENSEREVLVDDLHQARSVVGVVPGKDRVRGQVGVERGLELVHEIAGRQSEDQFATFWCDPRIAGAPSTASFLEELITNRHCSSLPHGSASGNGKSRAAARSTAGDRGSPP
jgi:hypothetical protein